MDASTLTRYLQPVVAKRWVKIGAGGRFITFHSTKMGPPEILKICDLLKQEANPRALRCYPTAPASALDR